ncbi:hypothetical protein [Streptomyces phaeochromogenes]|uniref:hypothetical protein n=1 Tax=Streptomyces phaeochromogenes TaxID=1923 RepID=UPI0038678DA6|nr:hypothetical protein OHB08_27190 [Streptomyces phaeochromogenes]
MTKSTSLGRHTASGLAVAAATAAAVGLVASPASAAEPWESLTVPTTYASISVLPFDNKDAYAKSVPFCFDECSSSPKLWQRTGGTWKQTTPPSDAEVGVLAGTGVNDLWVFGSRYAATGSYRFNHYDGTKWTSNLNPEPKNAEVLDAEAVSRNSVWAVGNYRATDGGWHPMATHWDGSAWKTTRLTGIEGQFNAVDVNSDTDIWAVGYRDKGDTTGDYQPLAMHYDGTEWREVPVPETPGQMYMLNEVISNGPNDVWIASGSKVSQGNGKTWTRHDTPASWPKFAYHNGQLYAGLYGSPKLVRWNGTAWVQDTSLTQGAQVDQLTTTPDGSLYAVHSEGNSVFWYNAFLSRLAPPTTG